MPEDRWDHGHFHDPDPERRGRIRNAKGGFIERVADFDAEFFGYYPAEAQRLDPQQRLLLEVSHEAMEDAGIRRDHLAGSRTSVFVGSFMYDYLALQTASEHRYEINPYVGMGTAVSGLANRISYNFDLRGPSVTLDTACSSSLVAVHLACRSLWAGEADMAMAAGVNAMLRPESSILLSRSGFLNPDQYCKSFDAAANGYVRAEGVGVVILKPLHRAIAEKNAIYAIVRGTAVNQDGHVPEGLTVPSEDAQVRVLKAAYGDAGVDPATVAFVEAHGPGTPVGDPVEARALGSVIGRAPGRVRPCFLGSVKSNLGHLEGASGIAGFIKGVLSAYNRTAPKNLHFDTPNGQIDFDGLYLRVPTTTSALDAYAGELSVGVSSFGAGGTNVHIVLQPPPTVRVSAETSGSGEDRSKSNVVLYQISAASPEALAELASRHAALLRSGEHDLVDIAYTAFTRRSRYRHVLAFVAGGANEAVELLSGFARGESQTAVLRTAIARKTRPKIGFIFSGQGGQWARMGRELMDTEPVFRETVHDLAARFYELTGWSLIDELLKPRATSRIDETVIVQPAIMAIQIGLHRLYHHYGIHAEGVVGHSIGEVAAALAAGALDVEGAVRVMYHRSRLQDRASGKGVMLATGLSESDAREFIAPAHRRVSIAAVNGPRSLVLSGDRDPLEEIAQALDQRGVFHRFVNVQVPYHSHHMDGLREELVAALASLEARPSKLALYSTVTGRRESGLHLHGDYWFHNARDPVRLTQALRTMCADGFDTFVEIGPHPVLLRGVSELLDSLDGDSLAYAAMRRDVPERSTFLLSVAQLASRGSEPSSEAMFGRDRVCVPLPRHPWRSTRHWFELPEVARSRLGPFPHPFLERKVVMSGGDEIGVWTTSIGAHTFPYLVDHRVQGEIVFPATGHLELAWAAAHARQGDRPFFLEDLRFESALILPEVGETPLRVCLEQVSAEGEFRLVSNAGDTHSSSWSLHSSGRVNATDRFEPRDVSLEGVRTRLKGAMEIDPGAFYHAIEKAGLGYGRSFRCVKKLWRSDSEILGLVSLPDELVGEARHYTVHPALLDACLHIVFANMLRNRELEGLYLPRRVERVRFHAMPTRTVWAYATSVRGSGGLASVDVSVFDEVGKLVAELRGLTSTLLTKTDGENDAYDECYQFEWVPSSRASRVRHRALATRSVLVCSDPDAAAPIAERLEREGLSPTVIEMETGSLDDLLSGAGLAERMLIVFSAMRSHPSHERSATREAPCDFAAVETLLSLAAAAQANTNIRRVCLVTNGARGVDERETSLDLAQATLQGMARVIANESPDTRVVTVDLSPVPSELEFDALMPELLDDVLDISDMEVAFRGSTRLIRRLVRVDQRSAEEAATRELPGVGGDYVAALSDPGIIDTVAFRQRSRRELAPDEVEIGVHAAGLNFRDIMHALGMLIDESGDKECGGAPLGREVSGHVLRVGHQVEHVHEGDQVVARVVNGFAGRVVVPACCVFPKPVGLTHQQAASLPVVWVTAWYALDYLGRVKAGEFVLIHAASGGVGSAAVQLVQRAGAKVIATAGSEDKREFLRRKGVQHVFDSRAVDFYDGVMEVTRGRGVDIVLNSLSGEFLTQSIKCLAPFGRFIELGKADVNRNTRIGLRRLESNISYHVVDIVPLSHSQPEVEREAYSSISRLLEDDQLDVLDTTVFPIAQLSAAMKLMARAKHRGKIILDMEDTTVTALPARFAKFRSDRAYLISGGATGFGLEIAKWMAAFGAKYLVLASRSGPKTPADRDAVEQLRAEGVSVCLEAVDVSDLGSVYKLIARCQQARSLAGVVHAAGVLDDASIRNMGMARFRRVFDPKAIGAWNLHEATLAAGAELDFFLMLSSVSSVVGLYGQVNYAAANFFQDSLALYRRRRGLPATSINLGLLGTYAGMSRAEGDEEGIAQLEAQGFPVMPLRRVLDKLQATLVQGPAQRVAATIDWGAFSRTYPQAARDSCFAELIREAAERTGDRRTNTNLQVTLGSANMKEGAAIIEAQLVDALARILDIAPDKLDVGLPLDALGLDSLTLNQLRNWIVQSLGLNVALMRLLKGPTITSLASDLMAELRRRPGEPEVSEAPRDGVTREKSIQGCGQESSDDVRREAQTFLLDLRSESELDPRMRPESLEPEGAACQASVLLTGATGFLGAYLLRELLDRTQATIHCLVRAASEEDARQRLWANLGKYRLRLPEDSSRIIALPGDLTEPRLGLDPRKYEELAEQLGAIYHNGAQLNFVLPYHRLAPSNVAGTRSVLDLACRGRAKDLHHVSTTAVFEGEAYGGRRIVESEMPQSHEGMHVGYSQSKWVAERLVAQAHDRGLRTTVHRPYLIAGDSRTGSWNTDDVVCRMLKGCILMGMIPDLDMILDMPPVDYVARAIVHLSAQLGSRGCAWHFVNPRAYHWNDLVETARAFGYPLQVLPYALWREHAVRVVTSPDHPLFALLPFFVELAVNENQTLFELYARGRRAVIDAARTTAALVSADIHCPPASDELWEMYLCQLVATGFLPRPS